MQETDNRWQALKDLIHLKIELCKRGELSMTRTHQFAYQKALEDLNVDIGELEAAYPPQSIPMGL